MTWSSDEQMTTFIQISNLFFKRSCQISIDNEQKSGQFWEGLIKRKDKNMDLSDYVLRNQEQL